MATFQLFNQDSLASRYIKSLLNQQPVPLYRCVSDDDYLLAGSYYIYTNFVIKCTTSGKLFVPVSDILYPGPNIYPSIFCMPGTGITLAKFQVITIVNTEDKTYCSTFQSSENYYDSQTHKHLIQYLRFLRETSGLNLLPYCNIYSGELVGDTELAFDQTTRTVTATRVRSSRYRVLSVPILIGKTYSIYIDSPQSVCMKCVVRSANGYVDLDDEQSKLTLDARNALKEFTNSSSKFVDSMSFHTPVTYRVQTTSAIVDQFSKNIVLLIQLPLQNDSSVVVIEGTVPSKKEVSCNENSVRIVPTIYNLSLIQANTKQTYAFSNRLVEYLLNNVTHEKTSISQNIEKIQTALANNLEHYANSFARRTKIKGIWDSSIKSNLFNIVANTRDSDLTLDHDFNVNSDIERILHKEGINY